MRRLNDYQRFGEELQCELDQLEVHRAPDQPYIEQFVHRNDGTVTDGTLALYLRNLRKTAERIDHPLIEFDAAGLDAHSYWLRREAGPSNDGFTQSTVRNVQFAVRLFLKTIDVEGTAWAEDYEILPPEDTSVSSEELLTSDDIGALVDGANNLRDMALIEFLADTGARLSLAGSLRVGDLDLEGDRATYRPNDDATGLKGAPITDYPLIDSPGTLRTYLHSTHPRPDRDDVAFFHRLPGHGYEPGEDDGTIAPNTIRQQLRVAAENAGVDKPVNPHNFRHSAVTRMAREGYSRSQIEHRVHWTIDTDMWATYEHIAAEEHNDDIFAHAGIESDDSDPLSPEREQCGNCFEHVAPHHEFCPRCGAAVSARAQRHIDDAESEALALATDEDDPDRRRVAIELAQALDIDSELAAAVVEQRGED
jgi:integrase